MILITKNSIFIKFYCNYIWHTNEWNWIKIIYKILKKLVFSKWTFKANFVFPYTVAFIWYHHPQWTNTIVKFPMQMFPPDISFMNVANLTHASFWNMRIIKLKFYYSKKTYKKYKIYLTQTFSSKNWVVKLIFTYNDFYK